MYTLLNRLESGFVFLGLNFPTLCLISHEGVGLFSWISCAFKAPLFSEGIFLVFLMFPCCSSAQFLILCISCYVCVCVCVACASPERITWWGLLWIPSTAESLLCGEHSFPTTWECVKTKPTYTYRDTHTHTHQGEWDCYTLSACRMIYRCPYLCCQVEDMIFFFNFKSCCQQTACAWVCVELRASEAVWRAFT